MSETVYGTYPEGADPRWWHDALRFLFHAGWCPTEDLARLVLTRIAEGRTAGAVECLKNDCDNLEESQEALEEVAALALWWLKGQPK